MKTFEKVRSLVTRGLRLSKALFLNLPKFSRTKPAFHFHETKSIVTGVEESLFEK